MLLFKRYEYNPQSDMIGKGGFSRVYKAIDKKLNRPVALKVYKSSDMAEKYSPIAEIQRVIGLDHPNIARYLDIEENENENAFGEVEKIQVCVMEFLDGGNLAQYYNSNKDLSVFKKLIVNVLNGLTYLHENEIIHRDIKPGNILIKNTTKGPVAKITDFGISKRSDSSFNSTSSALIVSIPYMAPEQLNARRYGIDENISYNIDLWSLGVAVYEIIAGEMLFKNSPQESSEQIMINIMEPEIPNKINKLPQPFRDFVNRCVVKDAKERVNHAEDLISVIEENIPATYSNSVPEKLIEVPAVTTTHETNKSVADILQNEEPEKNNTVNEKDDTIEHEVENANTDDTIFLTKKQIPVFEEESGEEITQFISKESLEESDEEVTQFISKETLQAYAETNNESPDNIPVNATETHGPDLEDTLIIYKNYLPGGDQSEQQDRTNSAEQIPQQPVIDKQPEETEKTPAVLQRKEKPVNLFNRYDYFPVSDLIGKGGFSRVYKAYDKKLNRWVALKIYKTGEFSERYSPIAEIRRVVNLDHPNICRYLDIEEIEKENPFGENEIMQICVMELMDSGNLAEYYMKNKSPEVFKKLLHDILNGLAYLHRHGIIHRDIKPQNILIKSTLEGPIAKITDFGISKASDNVSNNSTSAMVVSIPYMAPEQLNVKKYGINDKISFNLDLWSLGVTVYEIISGKVLFKNSEQDSSEQIMTNIMASGIPEKINDLPEPFRQIVASCVVKNAKERIQKAEDLLKLTEPYQEPVVQPKTIITTPPEKIIESTPKKKSFLVEETPPEVKQPVLKKEIRKKEVFKKEVHETPAPVKEKKHRPADSERPNKKPFSKGVIALVVVIIAVPIIIFWHPWGYGNVPAQHLQAVAAADSLKPATAEEKKKDSVIQPEKKEEKIQEPAVVNADEGKKKIDDNSKKEKTNTETKAVEIPSAITDNEPISYRIYSDKSCSIQIEIPNDQPKNVKIKAGTYQDVRLIPGEYVATVVNLSDTTVVKKFKLKVQPSKGPRLPYRIPWEKF